MSRRDALKLGAAAGAAVLAAPRLARAADPIRIGLILPMTGAFQSTGRQIENGIRVHMRERNNTVAGRPVEFLLRDDGNVADASRRLAQELAVNDKVRMLAGFGLTPLALATVPIATRAKLPMVVMAAATSSITEQSPFIVRIAQVVPQTTAPMAEWAANNGIRRVVTLVSDYGPGQDAETWFKRRFTEKGGQVVDALRVPLANPDFAPFLQRVRDLSPDAMFVFVPAGAGAAVMKQFAERGLDRSGIKMIALGDVTEDDILPGMGDPALGVVTSHHYSVVHDSDANRRFLAAYRETIGPARPNYMAVHGYDGAALICRALEAAGPDAEGAALVEAMKGMAWESPRGPISIDPKTRDIIQNVYIRRVERRNGELYNVEFDTLPNVRDPAKA
ncbi:ABC transporter substrate-binding protein [Roseomonas sp. BN140053]|uniref:ABC transporter substrate-binding protein n=1 Tax=Roseomonas sp. BN140053 TaxID=3391898 RepID=UPI0039EBEBB5